MGKSILVQTLNQIVSDKGKDVLQNGTLVINLFADYCPQGTAEKNKLKSAYEHGIIQELIKDTKGNKDGSIAVNKAIQALKDRAFMDETIATAFIYEIAEVLKLKYTQKVNSTSIPPKSLAPQAHSFRPPTKVKGDTPARVTKPQNLQTHGQSVSTSIKTLIKNKSVKTIGILAGVVAMLLIITVVVFVNQSKKNRGYCELELSPDKSYYIVTGYEGKKAHVAIPAVYKDKPVTHIADEAFRSADTIETIAIPNSITSIGERAFMWCTSLRSIIIPDSVTHIGDNAFVGCELTSVELSDSITVIGNIFGGNDFVTITIPDTVTSISDGAFAYCSNLESITIPDSVTYIGYAFEGCKSLNKIYYEGDIEDWCNITFDCYSGIATNWGLYINKKIVTDLVIPDTVNEIKACAFAGCSSLKNISMSKNISRVGEKAFYNCTSLKFNEYGDITQNGRGRYLGNDSNPYQVLIDASEKSNKYFLNFIIHNQTEVIADNALDSCGGFNSVSIPDSIKYVGVNAFEGAWNVEYNEYDNAYYLGNENNPYLVLIDAQNKSITSCEIHADTKIIASYAFYECIALSNISIPHGVTSISDNAFSLCDSIYSITIPDSVTSIGNHVFAGCESLTNITIPSSVTSIGEYSFNNFYTSEFITFGGTKAQWVGISQNLQFPPCYYGTSGTPLYTRVHCIDGTLTYISAFQFE